MPLLVVTSSSGAPALWLALTVWLDLQPRPVPEVSPQHIGAPPRRAADSCTTVVGVKHCPLPPLGAEPRGRSN